MSWAGRNIEWCCYHDCDRLECEDRHETEDTMPKPESLSKLNIHLRQVDQDKALSLLEGAYLSIEEARSRGEKNHWEDAWDAAEDAKSQLIAALVIMEDLLP